MNKIILHFYIMYKRDSIELVLDKRLSFNENFELFKDHEEIRSFKNRHIMAYPGFGVLDKNIQIKSFNLKPLTRLYVY